MISWKPCAGAVLLAAAGSLASWAFEGRLVEEHSGAPVVGATVTVVGQTGAVRTDGDGRFTWQPDPPTPFELVVLVPGQGVVRPFTIDRLDAAAITTIPIAAVLDESITVEGVAPSIDATPAAGMTLLSGEQIERRSPANLMQALETVPGVSQVSEGQAAVPALRGLARGRTLVLIDGARVTSERRVGPSATYLDPAVVEGIDVARGPGSVAYGSDALGGVISVRTRRVAPGSPFRARAEASAGTGVPETGGMVELSGSVAGGGLLALAHVRHAGDYDAPAGEVYNSGWEDGGLLLRFERPAGRGLLTLGYEGDFARDTGRPRGNSHTVRFYYPYENSNRVTGSWEAGRLGALEKLTASAFIGTYEQRTDQDRESAPARTIERADVSAQDFGLRGIAEFGNGRSRFELGVDVNGRRGLAADEIRLAWNTSGEPIRNDTYAAVEDADRLDLAAFAQVRTAASSVVMLSAGIRGDQVTTHNEGGYFGDRSSEHGALSGFAAVGVGPFSAISATLQAARGFRDPTLSDRYYRGPSGRGYVTGNPELEPESSEQFDLAVHAAFGPVRVAGYLFRYDIDDLIERYVSGPTADDFAYRNRDRARVRGAELELQASLGRGFALEAGAQSVRGATTEDGKDMDDIPADNASLMLGKEWKRGYAQVRLACYARDDRPGPTENPNPAPGYTRVDFQFGWRVSDPHFELRAQVRNAFDAEYWASPDTRWVYAPGRAVSVTASYRSAP